MKHPSRVRGPDQWCLPGGLVARFGRCAAKALWCSGFRLAVLTPLLNPVPIRWALVPAAVNERELLEDQLDGLAGLKILADKGLRGRALSARLAERGIRLLTPPPTRARAVLPQPRQRFIAAHRNRIEGGFAIATDQLHLEQHRARTPWGLLTRVVGKLTAFTIRAAWRRLGREVE